MCVCECVRARACKCLCACVCECVVWMALINVEFLCMRSRDSFIKVSAWDNYSFSHICDSHQHRRTTGSSPRSSMHNYKSLAALATDWVTLLNCSHYICYRGGNIICVQHQFASWSLNSAWLILHNKSSGKAVVKAIPPCIISRGLDPVVLRCEERSSTRETIM